MHAPEKGHDNVAVSLLLSLALGRLELLLEHPDLSLGDRHPAVEPLLVFLRSGTWRLGDCKFRFRRARQGHR